MPTIIAYHDVDDTAHWLASPKREEFFGPRGITNIRTFTNPQNPSQVGLLMDVPDLDDFLASLQAYMRWAVDDVLAYSPRDAVVPPDQAMPHWGWDGLQGFSKWS